MAVKTVTVTCPTCFCCNKASTLDVPAEGAEAYRDGALAQDAFPTLSVDEREQLISGTHPACWERLFG